MNATINSGKRTRVRLWIVMFLFLVTTINYADRATLSIAGSSMQKELGISAEQLGFIFSAFGWAYVICQIPGGWLLDRFGAKKVYGWGIALWSLFTMLQGAIHILPGGMMVPALFLLRFLVGVAEAPSFPGNGRITAAWFPAKERGSASALFNSAQYFATVVFAPLMGWMVASFGWHHVFIIMGVIGLVVALVWTRVIHNPRQHPRANKAEIDYIAEGGALVDMDKPGEKKSGNTWFYMKQLLAKRMMLGVYLGQYGVNGVTYFFLTWFPVYLVQERGMSILKAGFIASLPALCGFAGGVLGGIFSDWLLRRGHSLTFARKLPIVLGMGLSAVIVVANYVSTEWIVVAVMALAFFGKGVGALGWAVVSDTAPKQIIGLAGSLFNMFGNLASITTPIVIGYLVGSSGSFASALAFVAANGALVVVSYLVIVGKIERIELRDPPSASQPRQVPVAQH
jgi:MFS transporter, ACS family, glucarate transporter